MGMLSLQLYCNLKTILQLKGIFCNQVFCFLKGNFAWYTISLKEKNPCKFLRLLFSDERNSQALPQTYGIRKLGIGTPH